MRKRNEEVERKGITVGTERRRRKENKMKGKRIM